MRAALGEAAYMTGLERNGDVVAMASYAPLFVNVNDRKWNPDAIVYDNYRSYGTPSYYVQKLFRTNQGGTVLPTTLQTAQTSASAPAVSISGAVGVGTWKTQAEFRNLAVTTDIGKIVIGTGDTASAISGFQRPSPELANAWGRAVAAKAGRPRAKQQCGKCAGDKFHDSGG